MILLDGQGMDFVEPPIVDKAPEMNEFRRLQERVNLRVDALVAGAAVGASHSETELLGDSLDVDTRRDQDSVVAMGCNAVEVAKQKEGADAKGGNAEASELAKKRECRRRGWHC